MSDRDANLATIHRLNGEYKALTGRDLYLYTARPGDGQTRVVFADTVCRGYAAGVEHMQAALTAVREQPTA